MKMLLVLMTMCLIILFNSYASDTSRKQVSDSLIKDEIITFPCQFDVKDSTIINATNRQIDVLLNGINDFLGGHENRDIYFVADCKSCQTFRTHADGLQFDLFLLIDQNGAFYYKKGIRRGNKNATMVKTVRSYKSGDTTFTFSQGHGMMTISGSSCIDADYVTVTLVYHTGTITVKRLLNASFFEYDLDNDSRMEQYLFGTRNCSNEMAILRIRE